LSNGNEKQDEQKHSRGVRRRMARQKAFEQKLTTVSDVKTILDRYHTHMIDPRIEFLEEYVFYKRMKPWEKAQYHWLNFKGWCNARYRAFERFVYSSRWDKENKAVMDRMAKGETIEHD
jgi:hypothetical protein